MRVSATRAITVGVSSIERALGLFRDVMRLRIEDDGEVSRSLLSAWGLGADDSARMVELSCRGQRCGRLRLIEYATTQRQKVRNDFGVGAPDSPFDVGPKAIDFYALNDISSAFDQLVKFGCVPRSKLRRHRIGQTISEEVAFSGPDDLPILLMVGHNSPNPHQPFSEIATTSVICEDLAASREFYGAKLGLTPINDVEASDEFRSAANELLGVPPNTRTHFLLYGQPGEESGKILLLHFPGEKGKRLVNRMRPGCLGLSMFSHDVDHLDTLYSDLVSSGSVIVCPPVYSETFKRTKRIFLARGPNEELFEFSSPT